MFCFEMLIYHDVFLTVLWTEVKALNMPVNALWLSYIHSPAPNSLTFLAQSPLQSWLENEGPGAQEVCGFGEAPIPATCYTLNNLKHLPYLEC